VDHSGEKPELTFSGDEKKALTRLQSVLEDAVRLQLVSDVPVGVFLSGGMLSDHFLS
jgi:asparagine synthase (glutamine-hydrolysing)